MWRWRESGGGKTRTGKEKQPEPNRKSIDKKLKFLEEILDKERNEKDKFRILKEEKRLKEVGELEAKRLRLELKITLE